MSVFTELKRRNVFRVAAAYLVASWLLIEVSATLEETLRLPEWADSLLAMFLILGFPLALFFSWAYEITPDGIKREKDVDAAESSRAQNARRLDWAVIFMVALAAVLFAADRFLPDREGLATGQAESQALAPMAGQTTAEVPMDAQAGLHAVPNLSIAVMPFVNMSSDPEQEYFSDGLTEELLNLLADIDQLKVAARTSSFYYKDKTEQIPFPEIGRQLGVAHLLEGSVRRDGNRIRVTAQLIKVDDGFHLWSQTWDRELESIFAIQDEIAAGVVEQLKIQLLGETPHARVVDTESWELTQQARFLWKRRGEGDWEKAFELFKRAIELDEYNADAWLGAAPLFAYVQDPPDVEASLHALLKAMELDPSNAEARARYALFLEWTGDTEQAWIEAQRALKIDPEDSFTLGLMAQFADEDGDSDLSLEYLRQAVAADPLYVLNLVYLSDALLRRGNLDEAETYAQRVLDIDPDNNTGISQLADVRLLQGRGEEALELARQLPGAPTPTVSGVLRFQYMAKAYQVIGDRERSDAVLANYIEQFGQEFPVDIAALYAWRGDVDLAFEWLQRALDSHTQEFRLRADFNEFDALHGDPRWEQLLTDLESR